MSKTVCDFILDDLRQHEALSLLLSPFHSICSHPQTLVQLGWVRTWSRGGAKRTYEKGCLHTATWRRYQCSTGGDLAHQAKDGDCSWRLCSPIFLQWYLTVIFPYQKKSCTNLSLQTVLNICKKFREKHTLHSKKNKSPKNPK